MAKSTSICQKKGRIVRSEIYHTKFIVIYFVAKLKDLRGSQADN